MQVDDPILVLIPFCEMGMLDLMGKNVDNETLTGIQQKVFGVEKLFDPLGIVLGPIWDRKRMIIGNLIIVGPFRYIIWILFFHVIWQ